MEVVRVDLLYFPSQNKNALQPGVFVLTHMRYYIPMTYENYLKALPAWGEQLTLALTTISIYQPCTQLSIDHICIRLNSVAEVDALRDELQEVGTVISRATINGRDIYIFQLHTPLRVADWSISALELPYPKEGALYTEGWEHVEFVLPHAPNTLAGIKETFFATFPHLTEEHLTSHYSFKVDEPSAAVEQLPNPTVAFKMDGIGIKFHAKSIQEVVGYTG